jgi:hypothetical protein
MTMNKFRRPRSVLLMALLIAGAWLATTALPVSAKAYRYLNPIFPNVTVSNNLIYGHAKLSDGRRSHCGSTCFGLRATRRAIGPS